ncbi:hypothetical protein N9L92_03175 [Saprospiraceae bacterium]|nr:hypothetical protein [Saprospiraceae bacterium]
MKNLFFTFLICLCGSAAFGQFNFGAGAQLTFDPSAIGAQGKVLYEWDDTWRGAGTFTFYFDSFVNWSIDLDAQYKLLQLSENFDLAPIGGLSITSFDLGLANDTEIGINLGAFIDFVPSDSYHIYLEPKIIVGGFGSLVVSGGILF